MDLNSKKELLFYYESRQNPNGDPGFENQPRLMPDGTIMVTDVRIKRTVRDYAKTALNETIFVDYDNEGKPITADGKAREIIGSLSGDVMAALLKKTFDVPLFGALVPIRAADKNKPKKDGEGEESNESGSEKLTGPLQFGIGRSVNQVHIINPTISGRFVGKLKQGQEDQFSTFGKFYSVEYALIKIHGGINPANLGKYFNDEIINQKFLEKEKSLITCLWNGTNELITRSKFPQRSIFYFEIEYNSVIYNDLPLLVEDSDEMKGNVKQLGSSPFKFDRLILTLKQRRSQIKKIRIKYCDELQKEVKELVDQLKSNGTSVEEI